MTNILLTNIRKTKRLPAHEEGMHEIQILLYEQKHKLD